jgi:hypothetical protein
MNDFVSDCFEITKIPQVHLHRDVETSQSGRRAARVG